MSKLLTTGQLIEKIKVGEIAELEEDKHIPKKYGPSYCHVFKNQDGDIRWCKKDGSLPSSSPLELHGHVIMWKWRILPNYVSFEEAIKALKNNKKIIFHTFNTKFVFELDSFVEGLECFSWIDLIEGKWTIEGDFN